MTPKPKPKKETHYKCTHCGDEIYWNTHKKLTHCKCGTISVDGCEYYVRINGNEEDYKKVLRLKKIERIGLGRSTRYRKL